MKKIFCGLLLVSTFSFAQNTLSYTEQNATYSKGVELYERQAYTAARKTFDTYLKSTDQNVDQNSFTRANAAYYSALSALHTNAPDADNEIERFVLNYSEHPKAKLIFTDLADNLYENGNYKGAIQYFKRALATRNQNLLTFGVRYKLGVSYFMTDQKDLALIEFNQVKNSGSEFAPNAAYYSGIINYEQNNFNEALVDLKKIEGLSPFNKDVPNLIGQILYQQKRFDELLAYTEPIIQNPQGRNISDLALVTAEVFFFKDNFEKAAFYYDRLKKTLSPQVSFRHGYSYFKTEQYAKALPIFKRIAANNNELGQQAAYYLGIAALNSDDLPAALAAFEAAERADFDQAIKEEASFNAIKVLIDQKKYSLAIKNSQNHLANFKTGKYTNETNEFLTELLFESNNYNEAIRYIESISNKTPKIKAAYQKLTYNKGVTEFNSEKFNDAITWFNKSLLYKTDSGLATAAQFWLAESSFALDKPEAEGLYKSLLNSSSQKAQLKSRYSLGYLYYNKKDYKTAQNFFQQFYDQTKNNESYRQNNEDALIRLADCHLIAKDFNKALSLYNTAYINNQSNKDYALYQKGLSLRYLGKNAESKAVFDSFNRQFADSRLIDKALYENATIALASTNYKEAISGFSELLAKKPNSSLVPEALLKRALCYSNINNSNAAILDYKTILTKFGTTTQAEEALIGVRETLNQANRSEEFSDFASIYKRNNPNSTSVTGIEFDAAKNLFYNEKYQQAIYALEKYIKDYSQSPNTNEANFLLGESYFIENKEANALKYYQRVLDAGVSDYLSKSAYRSGSISLKNKDYTSAVNNFEIVEKTSSNQREIVTAWQGLMLGSYETKNYTKAKTYANKIANEANGIVIGAENKASLYLGKAEMQEGNTIGAKTAFEKTMALAKDQNAAEAKYLIALMEYEAKDFDGSIKTLQELAGDYSDFLTWYENAFLLIADNYEAKDDSFMAEATLKSIIENSESPETVARAKDKLKKLSNE